MDQGRSLIRMIARSFYDTKSIIVVDALMQHSALRDDDLAYLLGMQTKELRKLCSKLREDRLVTEATRSELRDGQTRPQTRTYYFIDYHRTIDAIKWRLSQLSNRVGGASAAVVEERKDFRCPRCGARWTTLEAIDSLNPSTGVFACHRCGSDLVEDDDGGPGRDMAGYKDSARLQSQIEPFLKLLQAVDDATIPANDLETALAVAQPVIRDSLTNPVPFARPVDPRPGGARGAPNGPQSTRGLATSAAPLNVSMTDSSLSASAAADLAAATRAQALAAQNSLPVWHTNSTVSGEATALGLDAQRAQMERLAGMDTALRDEEERKARAVADAEAESDEVKAYYAQLEAEQAAEARRLAEEEDEEEDDDDDEEEDEDEEDKGGDEAFEDVVAPAANGGAVNGLKNGHAVQTPASDVSSPGAVATTLANTSSNSLGALKRKAKEEMEGHAHSVRIVEAKVEDSAEDDDDDDEEDGVEFEDV